MFDPGNVRVKAGELTLAARMLSDADRSHRGDYLRHGPYAGAIVKSVRKQRYGYFEIRAKTMKACVSNAFWLYDPHSDDPAVKFSAGDFSEEIDIFEITGGVDFEGKRKSCVGKLFGTIHFYLTPYLEGVVNGKKWRPGRTHQAKELDFLPADDYHVYGFLWTPEKLAWYLDGRQVFTRENDGLFHRPLHVVLDSEILAGWFGVPDPKDLPAEFRIDYVRVWAAPEPRNTALVPRMKIERDSYDWMERHRRVLEVVKHRRPEVVFVGDSITHFWAGAESYGGELALPRWRQAFGKITTLNLGYGWDRTGNVLWRLDHGEMEGVDPKLVVLHIGGNNFTTTKNYEGNTAAETAEGVLAVLDRIRAKAPRAKIVLMGIFPFGAQPTAPHRVKAREANKILAAEAAKRANVVFLDITDNLVGADGVYTREMARDFVHPTDAGYAVWVNALKPIFSEAGLALP